jgi:electron transfer flavoprotein alpha subunit
MRIRHCRTRQRVAQAATLNTVTAAVKIGGEVTILVAGHSAPRPPPPPPRSPASQACWWPTRAQFEHAAAEDVAALMLAAASGLHAPAGPATSFGKN